MQWHTLTHKSATGNPLSLQPRDRPVFLRNTGTHRRVEIGLVVSVVKVHEHLRRLAPTAPATLDTKRTAANRRNKHLLARGSK